ncbi:MAG: fumarate hydratase [Actinobacteria bacterium HGW-Actinobacteria-10]|nr:MAG: fumarate hydratase [Actinobacteria bacterium HGW-Actinobacteria-10]
MVDAAAIARAVESGVLEAAARLRPDVDAVLRGALVSERSERGRFVLSQLVENARIAATDGVPLCQDTGTVWVWVELGERELLPVGLASAVDTAVAGAYRRGGLRMSVARDALFDRANTGDNTPAFLDVTFRPGTGARVHVMLKGGGSDNASVLEMLPPSAGEAGVTEVVLRAVRERATGACPPLVLGVGIGTTFDKVGLLAKKALLREIGSVNPDPRAAVFEAALLSAVNETGIGPAGLGGDTTALAVHVATAPCHIAALPVAVNMGCCAMRSVSVDVD